ncbi:MAG TPA: thioesterase domain-containing protein, partial [Polyangiaceae bacterium]|nr:thioesterase domain-containing protein [Polyangiaceae bacterium]
GMQSLFAVLERQPGQLLVGVDPASPSLRRMTNEPARPLARARAAVSLKQVADPAQLLGELCDVKVQDRLGHEISAEPWWLHRFPLDAAGAVDREAVFNEMRGADAVIQPLTTELEKRLGAIWKDVLGLDALGANQSFFDLGGTSLLSVRLFSRIEKEFGVAFEPALLFKAATVGTMAKVLADTAGPVSQTSSEAASGTPLFLVDDGGGDATRYRGLAARLRPAHELIVLRPFGKDRIPTLHTHVDDMLAHYLEKLRDRSEHGPYALAGRGVGAALALELACTLQRSGEAVPFLALIDPVFPDRSIDIGDVGLKQVLRVGAELRGGVQQARAVLSRTVASLARQAFDRGRFQLLRYYTDRQKDPPWFVEHLPLETVYGYAAARRAPSQFSGRILVIRTPQAATPDQARSADWGRQASKGVAVHELGALFSNEPSTEAVELLSREVSASFGHRLESAAAG